MQVASLTTAPALMIAANTCWPSCNRLPGRKTCNCPGVQIATRLRLALIAEYSPQLPYAKLVHDIMCGKAAAQRIYIDLLGDSLCHKGTVRLPATCGTCQTAQHLQICTSTTFINHDCFSLQVTMDRVISLTTCTEAFAFDVHKLPLVHVSQYTTVSMSNIQGVIVAVAGCSACAE